MKLVAATKEHVVEMMAWFPDRDSCGYWGGPMFRFPFTERSFLEDVAWGGIAVVFPAWVERGADWVRPVLSS